MNAAAIESLIRRLGENIDVYRESEGALDDYGDPAPTWSKNSTEKMFITSLTGLRRLSEISMSGGRFKDIDQAAFAKPDSAAQAQDYLLVGSEKWRIAFVEDYKLRGSTLYKILFLKRFEV